MAILMVPKYLIFFVLLIPVAIQDDGILVVPTMAYLPPKLDGKEILSEEYKSSSFSLLSIASLSGCCQVKLSLSLSLTHTHTHTHTHMHVQMAIRCGNKFLFPFIMQSFIT
jgi:hypothetical protein